MKRRMLLMSISINHGSQGIYDNVRQRNLQSNFQKLSSGKKINSAKDDAAGCAISVHLTTQLSATDIAQKEDSQTWSALETEPQ